MNVTFSHYVYLCFAYDSHINKPLRGVLISLKPDQEVKKLQRINSGFIQHTPHEAQYIS